MSWLLDTKVLSEIRKGTRGDPGVQRWSSGRDDNAYISVLTLGELRRGVELKRRRDPTTAGHLDAWLNVLTTAFASRILPVDQRVADQWGRLGLPDRIPAIDGLLAATALVHRLTLVTRNVVDFAKTGVPVLDPFDAP
ncbi:MAG: type II toxin-antitoxin system VapC family toxin [Myxococcota bacterium]